jgi:hypothetical protein
MSDTSTHHVDTTEALKAVVAERDAEIARLNRHIEVERALRDAGAIDLEAAQALLDRDPESEAQQRPIAERVAALRSRKPFLFETVRRAASAQGPKPSGDPAREIERAAAEAASTGRRTDLLRYLRLRRKRE